MGNEPKQAKILVVEDESVTRKLVATRLERSGATVVTVEDGRAAVRAVLDGERNAEPFDLIVMDVLMPGLNGLDAARALRTKGYAGGIIAVSAFYNENQCLTAGCDDFLAKPFYPAQLLEKVSEYLCRQRT